MSARHDPGALRARAAKLARDLLRSRDGNTALVVALTFVPMMIGVGAAIDTARLHNAYSAVQADLDFALIAAVKEIGTENKPQIERKLEHWFGSQQSSSAAFTLEEITVDLDEDIVTATAGGTMPTTLLGIVGLQRMPVKVTSSAAGADKPHMQIFFALDKSASMLLAATPAAQTRMQQLRGCAFACHDGGSHSNYSVAKANNIPLRVDVATQAISKSLEVIEDTDPRHERVKVGLYRLGGDTREVLAPSDNFDLVRRRLAYDEYGMTSAESEEATRFDVSLPGLASHVGAAGDGRLAGRPEKLVLLVTDGVQSDRHWVHDDSSTRLTTPLNPAWCDGIKRGGAKVAVLYTEYLPLIGDWGYDRTVGATMWSAQWSQAPWNGQQRRDISSMTPRRDYIPYALKDCASSEELFMAADSQDEIERGIQSLLRRYLSTVRLTR